MYANRTFKAGCLLLIGVAHLALGSTPLSAPPSSPLASRFPGPLWQVVAPQGGTATVSNAHLFLNVPGGSNHDALLSANEAVRVLQPIANVNFDVSIKIDSTMIAGEAGTRQGLMVVTDDKNYLLFSIAADGKKISLGADQVNGGVAAPLFEQAVFGEYQNPLYLRLQRTATAFVAYYSVDGTVWTAAGSFNSSQKPAWVGPFASNYNANPAHAVAVVMAVNWFNIL